MLLKTKIMIEEFFLVLEEIGHQQHTVSSTRIHGGLRTEPNVIP